MSLEREFVQVVCARVLSTLPTATNPSLPEAVSRPRAGGGEYLPALAFLALACAVVCDRCLRPRSK